MTPPASILTSLPFLVPFHSREQQCMRAEIPSSGDSWRNLSLFKNPISTERIYDLVLKGVQIF